MRTKRFERRRIPVAFKILALPAWVGSCLLALGLFIGLLSIRFDSKPVLADSTDGYSVTDYQGFAALPRKGDVLGQRVDYRDTRILKLRDFLLFYNSPMVDNAADFVAAADRFDLPWTLLPAIACKESGCGRVVPYNSFNAFGWAVYTGQKSGAVFNSWSEAIYRVAEGLRNDYFNQGYDTVVEIESKYTPSSANSHHGWQSDVEYFMAELENWVF